MAVGVLHGALDGLVMGVAGGEGGRGGRTVVSLNVHMGSSTGESIVNDKRDRCGC